MRFLQLSEKYRCVVDGLLLSPLAPVLRRADEDFDSAVTRFSFLALRITECHLIESRGRSWDSISLRNRSSEYFRSSQNCLTRCFCIALRNSAINAFVAPMIALKVVDER